MKIAFDARAYGWTGIGRYIRNLLLHYRDLPSLDSFIVFTGEGNVDRIRKELQLPESRFSFIEVTPRYYSWQEQVILPWQLYSIQADLWHFTHFNVPLAFHRPYVVTIHDATRFVFPGQRRQYAIDQIAYEYVFASALSHARGAIFVSQATAQEVKHLPLSLPHIQEVIYEGVDSQFLAPVSSRDIDRVRQNLSLGNNPYILYVGVWMRHKNLWRLLQAFAFLREKHPELKMVVTGRLKQGYSDVDAWVQELQLESGVHIAGFVPHDDLPALYAGARAFTFPSLYEGFGLPPLEAAASGVPVVTSLASSLPEIMGGAAMYVNPEDVEDIVRGIEAVLLDSGVRDGLIQKGKQRALEFSWKACAEDTLTLYHRIGA